MSTIPPYGSLTSPDAMTCRYCPDCGGELLPNVPIHYCDHDGDDNDG